MSFINSLLNIFVGDKSKKDLKEVESIVKDILSYESELISLNHNELRNKTIEFKKQIAAVREPFNNAIENVKSKIKFLGFTYKEHLLSCSIIQVTWSSSFGVACKTILILLTIKIPYMFR